MSLAVEFRFGTCPTGIRAVSFIVATSIAEVQFDPDIATYAVRPSGVSVTQFGSMPPVISTEPRILKSGNEYL